MMSPASAQISSEPEGRELGAFALASLALLALLRMKGRNIGA
jgi:MYXO-CTERM domain-containing protein